VANACIEIERRPRPGSGMADAAAWSSRQISVFREQCTSSHCRNLASLCTYPDPAYPVTIHKHTHTHTHTPWLSDTHH